MNYLQLCNAVLRELNEVEITNVTSTRGLQTAVADFINKSQRDIINSEVEWPFTVANDSDTTVDGQRLYSFETSAKTLKLQGRDYGSSNDSRIHSTMYWENTGTGQFSMPTLTITAMK